MVESEEDWPRRLCRSIDWACVREPLRVGRQRKLRGAEEKDRRARTVQVMAQTEIEDQTGG